MSACFHVGRAFCGAILLLNDLDGFSGLLLTHLLADRGPKIQSFTANTKPPLRKWDFFHDIQTKCHYFLNSSPHI